MKSFLATWGRLTVLILSVAIQAGLAQDKQGTIDDISYPDEATARRAWQPMGGSDPVELATSDGVRVLRLPCRFAGKTVERASWDRRVNLDLTDCRGIHFRLLCRDVSPVSHFSIYFQSGEGWYGASFFPEVSGWNTITIRKADTTPEGKPAGWGVIRTIRISAWRGGNMDTELLLSDMRMTGLLGQDTPIAILRCDSGAQTAPAEARSSAQYAASVATMFEESGLNCASLSDVALTVQTLRKAKLVVLPYNPLLPDPAVEALLEYIREGGKIMTFYGLHARLRPVVGINAGPFVRADRPGRFAAIHFEKGALAGAPAVVGQNSWNIAEPKPVPGLSRAVAQWFDAQGQPEGHAAMVASSNCVEMAHVLLTDDPANKRRMLLAMTGYLVPDLWRQGAEQHLAHLGQIAGFGDFGLACAGIRQQGGAKVASLVEESQRSHAAATGAIKEKRFVDAFDFSSQAGRQLLDAYCTAQRPLAGEFRAFWCHSALGVDGMSWDAAIGRLASNGFTAILPNMLWGGLAYYDSQTLPVAPEVATRGDQIAQCVAACRKHGLQIHVWKVNWNLGRAPREFVDRMRQEGRLQASSAAKEEPWLCPSHPANQKLEIESIVEVARRYDVDGIHFDYIRYPDGDHCFCAGCKERFQKATGSIVPRWPQDMRSEGPLRQAWLDWRRDQITGVVKAVSQQARAAKPKIKLSAAVFRNWTTDRDSVGQDWKIWCDRGYLDFVCPMDYTESEVQFENFTRQQKVWAGAVPCYPGIGASATRLSLGPDQVIGQILVTRRHHMGGFTIFNYGRSEAWDLVPMLGKGITAGK